MTNLLLRNIQNRHWKSHHRSTICWNYLLFIHYITFENFEKKQCSLELAVIVFKGLLSLWTMGCKKFSLSIIFLFPSRNLSLSSFYKLIILEKSLWFNILPKKFEHESTVKIFNKMINKRKILKNPHSGLVSTHCESFYFKKEEAKELNDRNFSLEITTWVRVSKAMAHGILESNPL